MEARLDGDDDLGGSPDCPASSPAAPFVEGTLPLSPSPPSPPSPLPPRRRHGSSSSGRPGAATVLDALLLFLSLALQLLLERLLLLALLLLCVAWAARACLQLPSSSPSSPGPLAEAQSPPSAAAASPFGPVLAECTILRQYVDLAVSVNCGGGGEGGRGCASEYAWNSYTHVAIHVHAAAAAAAGDGRHLRGPGRPRPHRRHPQRRRPWRQAQVVSRGPSFERASALRKRWANGTSLPCTFDMETSAVSLGSMEGGPPPTEWLLHRHRLEAAGARLWAARGGIPFASLAEGVAALLLSWRARSDAGRPAARMLACGMLAKSGFGAGWRLGREVGQGPGSLAAWALATPAAADAGAVTAAGMTAVLLLMLTVLGAAADGTRGAKALLQWGVQQEGGGVLQLQALAASPGSSNSDAGGAGADRRDRGNPAVLRGPDDDPPSLDREGERDRGGRDGAPPDVLQRGDGHRAPTAPGPSPDLPLPSR